MTSIRRALELRLLLGLLALSAVLAGVLYLLIHESLVSQFDAALKAKARLLSAQVKRESDGSVEAEFVEHPVPEFTRSREPEYFEIVDGDGRTLLRSLSLGARDLHRPVVGNGGVGKGNLRLPDGRRGRVVALRFIPAAERGEERSVAPLLLVLAQEREPLDDALEAVLAALGVTGLLLLGGAVYIVRSVVHAGLRPLDRVADQAGRIDATSLDVRFPEQGMPSELAAICTRLNQLLGRLQTSFERERRFTSDVAHELRTPLAELRSLTEVALKWPDAESGSQESLKETLEIAVQMQHIVTNLLALARCHEGREEVSLGAVPLASLARDCWRPFQQRAAERGLEIVWRLADTEVRADRSLLSQILTNLFSNAVEYSAAGGRVECIVEARGEATALVVSNATETLKAADLPHLFEPFWRKDAARTDRGHVGLGLALVWAMAQRLGIEVRATFPEDGRFAVSLSFLDRAEPSGQFSGS